MLLNALSTLLHSAFLLLRLGNSAGSFPRPLAAAEEQRYIQLALEGDQEARSTLIRHNLRLVAHIVKKGYPSRKLFLGNYGRNEV